MASKVLQEFIVAVRFDVLKNEVDEAVKATQEVGDQAQQTQKDVGDANFKMAQDQAKTYKELIKEHDEYIKKTKKAVKTSSGEDKALREKEYQEALNAKKVTQQKEWDANKDYNAQVKKQKTDNLEEHGKAEREVVLNNLKQIKELKEKYATPLAIAGGATSGFSVSKSIYDSFTKDALGYGRLSKVLGIKSVGNFRALQGTLEGAGLNPEIATSLVTAIQGMLPVQKQSSLGLLGTSYKEGEAPEETARKVIQAIVNQKGDVALNARLASSLGLGLDDATYKALHSLNSFGSDYSYLQAHGQQDNRINDQEIANLKSRVQKDTAENKAFSASSLVGTIQSAELYITNLKKGAIEALGSEAAAGAALIGPIAGGAIVGGGLSWVTKNAILKFLPEVATKLGPLGVGIASTLLSAIALTTYSSQAHSDETPSNGGKSSGIYGGSLQKQSFNPSAPKTRSEIIEQGRRDVDRLVSFGMDRNEAASMIGSAINESKLKLHAQNPNSTAHGIFQHTESSGRKAYFRQLFGHPIEQATRDEQLKFAYIETQTSYKNRLNRARSLHPNEPIYSRVFEAPFPSSSQAQQNFSNQEARNANEILGKNQYVVNQNFNGDLDKNTAKAAATEAFRLIKRTQDQWNVG
jgi:hypothetical protein